MGKDKFKKFKLARSGQTVVSRSGKISRTDLQGIINSSIPETMDPEAKEELRLFAGSTDKVGFGYWSGRTESGDACGCPIASISDWVMDEDYASHPGRSLEGRVSSDHFIRSFDGKMGRRFGRSKGWAEVVD